MTWWYSHFRLDAGLEPVNAVPCSKSPMAPPDLGRKKNRKTEPPTSKQASCGQKKISHRSRNDIKLCFLSFSKGREQNDSSFVCLKGENLCLLGRQLVFSTSISVAEMSFLTQLHSRGTHMFIGTCSPSPEPPLLGLRGNS